jgi:hypothetical protein
MGFISEGTVTAKYKYLISGYILVIFILNLSLTILTGEYLKGCRGKY